MRSPHQLRIDEFMLKAGQAVPEFPREPADEVKLLRAKLILEEAFETIEKGLGVGIYFGGDVVHANELALNVDRPFDMVEFADGCADVSVVTVGSLSAVGIADEPLFNEVDQSNLRKFGPGGRRRDDGKWLKPPDWQPPDIEGELRRQGWAGQPAAV